MFGLLAATPVVVRGLLRDSPRSLWELSREHKDGWGVAIREASDWTIHRSTVSARACADYARIVEATRTRMLLAHIRLRTIGEVSLANTHPFRSGRVVFAHNGTVKPLAPLLASISPARLDAIAGDTDSERLFAFIATRIDDAGDVERGVVTAVNDLHALGNVGAMTFLLSCGDRIYAHRLGRSLHLLVRNGEDQGRPTPAVIVASEQLTDEAWQELPERSLRVIEDVAGTPSVRVLIG